MLAETAGLAAPVDALVAAARRAHGVGGLQQERDFVVAEWMTRALKITGIPPSPFFTPPNRGMCAGLVRFCFAKDDGLLAAAEVRMAALAPPPPGAESRARL